MPKPASLGEPLPRPNGFDIGNALLSNSAYARCLDLEHKALAADPVAAAPRPPQTGRLSSLVCARLLGQLLLEAPSDIGRMNIATEIVRCRDDGDLLQLANLYKDHFVRCFYQVQGRTPAPSSHPSAPSFDPKKNEIRELLHATPSSHTTAKAQALERDGYRCVISRRPDNPSIDAGLVEFAEEQAVWTQCAHIFDSSTNENLDDRAKKAYAASVHAILDRFGAINSIEELNGAKMHRLENVLTLESYIHRSFDQLKLWLQEVPGGPQHTYTVEAPPSHRNHLSCVPNTRVHFTTHDPVKRPLPDPRYLRLHAACARVAHLSGAAECIDQILREEEAIEVLASDGGSSELLNHILTHRLGITSPAFYNHLS